MSRSLSLYDRAMADGGMTQMSGTPSVICAGLYFRELPSMAAIEQLVREGLLSFDSLSSRPVRGVWEACGPFELEKHVLRHDAADEEDLLAFAEAKMSEPLLNRDAGPWWEMWACTTRDPGSRSMLYFRVEHACADGMAILQVLSRIATTLEGAPLPPAVFRRAEPKGVSWFGWLCNGLRSAFKYANLPLGSFDTACPFRPTPPCELLRFGERRLVVVPPHSLGMIKRIKNALGGSTTVNDVVYAAFAGAVRRYCEERDDAWSRKASSAHLRALVPLAFPRSIDTPLTNDWTFVSTELPVEQPTAAARVAATNSIFSRLKASPEALVARLAVALNATLPACLFGFVGRSLMSRHSVVFSNVPGPAQPIAIGGQPVLGLLPVFANLIPQVLCVSYRSQMWMTLTVDPALVREPQLLSRLYLDELRTLATQNAVDPDDTSDEPTGYQPPGEAKGAAEGVKPDPRELV